MTTLIELERLHWQRPSLHAPAADVAAWYEAKAAVHEHLATEARDELSRTRELDFADRARTRARLLLADDEAA